MTTAAELQPLIDQHREAISRLHQANIAEVVFGRPENRVPALSAFFDKKQRGASIEKLRADIEAAPGDWSATSALAEISSTLTPSQRVKARARGAF